MAKDRVRPYIYSAALADLKMLVATVQPDDVDFGIHALRVAGYNASLVGVGEDLTVAHGLWKSKGHTRYARFGEVQVAGIPAAMVGLDNPYIAVGDEEVGRPAEAVGPELPQGGGAGSSSDPPPPAPPPGWRCEAADRYVPPAHLEHVGPSSSAEQAWAVHREAGRLGNLGVLPARTRHGPVDADRQ